MKTIIKMKMGKKIMFALAVVGLTFMNCTSDDDSATTDSLAPTITVISPEMNQDYILTWGAGSPNGETAILSASAVDNERISYINITVVNSDEITVLEQTIENETTNDSEFTVETYYTAVIAGTYSVVFTATDSSGNSQASMPVTFTFCGDTSVESCIIPNASFDNFTEITDGDLTYELPNYWSESTVYNFYRGSIGRGFFSKYEGSDASNGTALQLNRSQSGSAIETFNKGYVHYECNTIPTKLIGRYKFNGTSSLGSIDRLRIVVKFSTASNPVTSAELAIDSEITGDYVKTFEIETDTSEFTDFEIDLSEFEGVPTLFISIHLMLKSGSGAIGNANIATAVIDDLEFLF
jgi:hypothetical protein